MWYEIILRFALSVFVGGLIGYEREYQNRPAGFITHILVCVGAAIIAMIQNQLVQDSINLTLMYPQLANSLKIDSGRIISQVVSGVGFLGAGAIIHNKGSVTGLTTAATLWVVACIGIACGMGYYFLSITSTIGVYCVLVVLKKVKFRIQDKISNKEV
ncbi:MgtC/SapB family protein [Abyssisolibacter fermentans]|uniref:MgtC/SapB family protein n=1 Tax=Abyssisolibacter fermentans TaxID=1766203 RepID=UPI000A8EBD91|nr:MgtC/SapB family protein [Abyssisolibacter fermentans]